MCSPLLVAKVASDPRLFLLTPFLLFGGVVMSFHRVGGWTLRDGFPRQL